METVVTWSGLSPDSILSYFQLETLIYVFLHFYIALYIFVHYQEFACIPMFNIDMSIKSFKEHYLLCGVF